MSKKAEKKVSTAPYNELPLHKENYLLMIAGFVVIIIGFVLISGDKDIYDFRKMVIGPIVTVSGFLFEIYAIMKKPKNKPTEIQ
jgi:hypothetical protein